MPFGPIPDAKPYRWPLLELQESLSNLTHRSEWSKFFDVIPTHDLLLARFILEVCWHLRTTFLKQSAHSLILVPEIKAILGGYVLDAFMSPMTLLIKGLGLALSVASGLSLGKEVRRSNLDGLRNLH